MMMIAKRIRGRRWDRVVPGLSEEGLLLAEMSHRVANEVSAALAAMRLVQFGRGGHARDAMIDAAVGRLEGFAGVISALRIPPGDTFDLQRGIEDLCDNLCAARDRVGGIVVSLDIAETMVDGTTARRVMMIAAELIHNAIRHALENRDGILAVVLRPDVSEVHLAVIDDGPGIRPGAATSGGMGRHIIAELVQRGGGQLSYESGLRGTTVRVVMPRTVGARTGG